MKYPGNRGSHKHIQAKTINYSTSYHKLTGRIRKDDCPVSHTFLISQTSLHKVFLSAQISQVLNAPKGSHM